MANVDRRLYELNKDELNIVAQKFRVKGFRRMRIEELREHLFKNIEPAALQEALQISWWDKYHNHVYGVSGISIAVLFYLFPFAAFHNQLPQIKMLIGNRDSYGTIINSEQFQTGSLFWVKVACLSKTTPVEALRIRWDNNGQWEDILRNSEYSSPRNLQERVISHYYVDGGDYQITAQCKTSSKDENKASKAVHVRSSS